MAARQTRIFQIAKALNISHTEILTFLKNKGVEVASHMSPVDKHIQDMIQAEFHKEREDMTLRKPDWTRYLRDPRAMKECYKIEMIDRTAKGLQ